LYHFS